MISFETGGKKFFIVLLGDLETKRSFIQQDFVVIYQYLKQRERLRSKQPDVRGGFQYTLFLKVIALKQGSTRLDKNLSNSSTG